MGGGRRGANTVLGVKGELLCTTNLMARLIRLQRETDASFKDSKLALAQPLLRQNLYFAQPRAHNVRSSPKAKLNRAAPTIPSCIHLPETKLVRISSVFRSVPDPGCRRSSQQTTWRAVDAVTIHALRRSARTHELALCGQHLRGLAIKFTAIRTLLSIGITTATCFAPSLRSLWRYHTNLHTPPNINPPRAQATGLNSKPSKSPKRFVQT